LVDGGCGGDGGFGIWTRLSVLCEGCVQLGIECIEEPEKPRGVLTCGVHDGEMDSHARSFTRIHYPAARASAPCDIATEKKNHRVCPPALERPTSYSDKPWYAT
jgi:hypothetical protein